MTIVPTSPPMPISCIVLIYMTPHSGHSVVLPIRELQKYKEVLRMETYVGRDPEIMVTHEEEDRAFHAGGQMVAKDLFWAIVVLIRGKMTTSGPKSGVRSCGR